MSDFQTADINNLLHGTTEPEEKEDINAMFARYDKELLSFENNVHHSRQWPSPIRKRECVK